MVLVVGGVPDLVAAVEEAAVAAQVLVTRCSVADVTTVAVEIRPLVIVMSDEVFLFDPQSFRALARDVHSRLLTVRDEERRVGVLEGALKALMAEAEDFGPTSTGEPGQR
jgi:hypothetical protein